jgi:Ca2+/Na+ antiporter
MLGLRQVPFGIGMGGCSVWLGMILTLFCVVFGCGMYQWKCETKKEQEIRLILEQERNTKMA